MINPNNKNFEIYMGTNNKNNPNNLLSQNLNHDIHNMAQMQYYPPYRVMNRSMQFNNILAHPTELVNQLNTNNNQFNYNQNANISILSSFSSGNTNNILGQKQQPVKIIPNNEIDPYSCSNCEDIYKMSIIHNVPLKILKCLYCNNVINNSSLDFYLRKYKDEIIKKKIKQMKENDETVINDTIENKVQKTKSKKNKKIKISNTEENDKVEEHYVNYSSNKKSESYNQKKNQINEIEGEQGVEGINEEWAGWVQSRKDAVKEKKIYQKLEKETKKELKKEGKGGDTKNNSEHGETKPESTDSQQQEVEDKIENVNGPSVAEMFKLKKIGLAHKFDKRKELEKEKELEREQNTPKMTVDLVNLIGKPKKDKSPIPELKRKSEVNINKINKQTPKEKNKKSAKQLEDKDELQKRKEKLATFTKVRV